MQINNKSIITESLSCFLISPQVFDVHIQNSLPLVQNLDIFGQVGFATAFDLNVPLKIKDGVIYIGEHTVNIDDDHFTVDFIKVT